MRRPWCTCVFLTVCGNVGLKNAVPIRRTDLPVHPVGLSAPWHCPVATNLHSNGPQPVVQRWTRKGCRKYVPVIRSGVSSRRLSALRADTAVGLLSTVRGKRRCSRKQTTGTISDSYLVFPWLWLCGWYLFNSAVSRACRNYSRDNNYTATKVILKSPEDMYIHVYKN